jgi:hypothetical protein
MMDDIVVPTIPAAPNHMVTSTDGKQQESSSIATPATTPGPSTWGEYKQEIPVLGLWNEYQPPKQPTYLHRYCSICEAAMVTLNPFKILICHECKQGIKNEELNPHNLHTYFNEGKDDEEEFLFQ